MSAQTPESAEDQVARWWLRTCADTVAAQFHVAPEVLTHAYDLHIVQIGEDRNSGGNLEFLVTAKLWGEQLTFQPTDWSTCIREDLAQAEIFDTYAPPAELGLRYLGTRSYTLYTLYTATRAELFEQAKPALQANRDKLGTWAWTESPNQGKYPALATCICVESIDRLFDLEKSRMCPDADNNQMAEWLAHVHFYGPAEHPDAAAGGVRAERLPTPPVLVDRVAVGAGV